MMNRLLRATEYFRGDARAPTLRTYALYRGKEWMSFDERIVASRGIAAPNGKGYDRVPVIVTE